MGKLDELFIKAKDLASVAGSKAQEMAELTKLRLQATQLRSDLDANYLKLGEIIYELTKAGAENQELIDMCVAEIESQNQELEELNAKIDEMKNVKKCPECMAANPKDALFCIRCGASLKPRVDFEEETEEPVSEKAPEPADAPVELKKDDEE